jgi:hypothetical protein
VHSRLVEIRCRRGHVRNSPSSWHWAHRRHRRRSTRLVRTSRSSTSWLQLRTCLSANNRSTISAGDPGRSRLRGGRCGRASYTGATISRSSRTRSACRIQRSGHPKLRCAHRRSLPEGTARRGSPLFTTRTTVSPSHAQLFQRIHADSDRRRQVPLIPACLCDRQLLPDILHRRMPPHRAQRPPETGASGKPSPCRRIGL